MNHLTRLTRLGRPSRMEKTEDGPPGEIGGHGPAGELGGPGPAGEIGSRTPAGEIGDHGLSGEIGCQVILALGRGYEPDCATIFPHLMGELNVLGIAKNLTSVIGFMCKKE
eukprot:TRINITY_DN21296_c0_g1_i1.p3 TRINITY_DN21296_c0_g1~~TRINITY_DN21296_c0_g1_i1.p3  ORF type:complete len:111 (-),score=19.50 TRINITY_DN21296_c0_g1_i1:80-412(-)